MTDGFVVRFSAFDLGRADDPVTSPGRAGDSRALAFSAPAPADGGPPGGRVVPDPVSRTVCFAAAPEWAVPE